MSGVEHLKIMKGQGNDARGQRQGSRSCRDRNTSFTSTIVISLKPLQLIFDASFVQTLSLDYVYKIIHQNRRTMVVLFI